MSGAGFGLYLSARYTACLLYTSVMENGQVLEQAEISRAGVHLTSALGRELIREATHPYEEVA